MNPYPDGVPPPMTLWRPIPKEYAARVLATGEQTMHYVDRRGKRVLAVVKAVPLTPWVVAVKMDEEEALADAVSETVRLAQVLGFVSLMLATTAFVILRSRRVYKLREAENAVRSLSGRLLRVQDDANRRIARQLQTRHAYLDHHQQRPNDRTEGSP